MAVELEESDWRTMLDVNLTGVWHTCRAGAPHNIRANCIHPTNVDTPMIQNDAVSSAFRPDLGRAPTRAEFAEAARRMNMLAVPWIDPVDVAPLSDSYSRVKNPSTVLSKAALASIIAQCPDLGNM
jgi:NAD(P)-dependent dehydrogenase (short-subunit alcohol dehydrogenase family)